MSLLLFRSMGLFRLVLLILKDQYFSPLNHMTTGKGKNLFTICTCGCWLKKRERGICELVTLCLWAKVGFNITMRLTLRLWGWLLLLLFGLTYPVTGLKLAVIAVNFLFADLLEIINGLNLVAWKSSDRSLKPLFFSLSHFHFLFLFFFLPLSLSY